MQTTLPPTSTPKTLTQFILDQQSMFAHEHASGSFSMLLQSIQLACKVISLHANKAGVGRDLGLGASYGTIQRGLVPKKLHKIAHDTMVECLANSKQVHIIASEQNETSIVLDDYQHGYAVTFDPLDGFSNIDANISVGTIFGIYRKKPNAHKDATSVKNLLRPGHDLVCAGYTLYGGATILVLTTGVGVNGFLLDPSLGEFILTHPNLKIPKKGKIYSVNEGSSSTWDTPSKEWLRWLKQEDPITGVARSSRYVGSMVADVHRTLLYGGIFCYPGSAKNPTGKLRLLYECNPMAFIIEQAGGKAITGTQRGTQRVLDMVPESLHQTIPLYLGSREEMTKLQSLYDQRPKL